MYVHVYVYIIHIRIYISYVIYPVRCMQYAECCMSPPASLHWNHMEADSPPWERQAGFEIPNHVVV